MTEKLVGKITQLTNDSGIHGNTTDRTAAGRLLREVGNGSPLIADGEGARYCFYCRIRDDEFSSVRHKSNCLWKRVRKHLGVE